jgi:transaldolase
MDKLQQLRNMAEGPVYLETLGSQTDKLVRSLPLIPVSDLEKLELFDEASFRLMLNEDAIATEKLAEGIRMFGADQCKLKHLIEQGYRNISIRKHVFI